MNIKLEYWQGRLEKAKTESKELERRLKILKSIKIKDCDNPEAVLKALIDNDWNYLESVANAN